MKLLINASFALVLVASLLASGCATKKYVQEETGAVNARVDDVEEQVESAQTEISRTNQRVDRNEQDISEASQTAREALQRAQEAGKLAEGKFLYETVLTDDQVRFGFDKSDLSPEAQSALDAFAEEIKTRNENVYLEIQGHTDAIGREEYNEELGLARAEAVRRYLSSQHQFPLHRISVISYGEAAPIADNSSREGRSQNRRVALVVLQ